MTHTWFGSAGVAPADVTTKTEVSESGKTASTQGAGDPWKKMKNEVEQLRNELIEAKYLIRTQGKLIKQLQNGPAESNIL